MIQGNPQQGAETGCLFVIMLPFLVVAAALLLATAK